ncbi:MAG TPA: GTP 3',8-cyclase MoaA [Mycobacteriales bacterium]|nr:GTP 3',8-cyclase MoaA [Mycobacteriales bacterium]
MVAAGALVDRFGRVHTDLRVSLTDRCTLRCTYCMPEEGVPWLDRGELLSDDEIVRVVSVAAGLGVRSVRLTGGEPLLRPGLADLVARLAAIPPGLQLSVTTNGLRLRELAPALAAAGLRRVNVSLDTLRPDVFTALTRRPGHDKVLGGLAAAAEAGMTPVKVNTVLTRGVNDSEVLDLLEFCLERGYELRFIESMPLDAQHEWSRDAMVPAAEIVEAVSAAHALTPEPTRGSAPAETWLVDGGPARLGIIASVTAPFCGACDRLRLTADGQIRNCLFATDESDLRSVLRSGASDARLAEVWQAAVAGKKKGHGIDDPSFIRPLRPMSAIGG